MTAQVADMQADRDAGATQPRPLAGIHGSFRVPVPANEPCLEYAPGSPERAELTAEVERQRSEIVEIPVIIGGQEIRTGDMHDVVMPHDHGHVIARFHMAAETEAQAAIEAARDAWRDWSNWNWEDRAAILLRAADLLAGPWRAKVNAATINGQSKNSMQAEIDAACELIDFWRFNCQFAQKVYAEQPLSSPGVWNRMDHRPLEGFVYAVSPFNFTAIGGNLSTSPALMGNVVLWKPATTSVLSSYYVMKLLEEAGMPPGVINFLPGHAARISDVVMSSPELAGVHFTGSTGTFHTLWKQVADNLATYHTYPRLVGETGGKDFIVAHESADPQAVAVAIVRGAFEYQGQKCSAASRAYIPSNLWDDVRESVLEMTNELEVGDPADYANFLGAVIDRPAYDSIKAYIDYAQGSEESEIIAGGGCDDTTGYFVEPTVVVAADPKHKLMCEEIFGPVITLHVYEPAEWGAMLDMVDSTSRYALTGAVFARDRSAIREASMRLRHAAGNYYINDKPSGAVVGQQPFGGARTSGTNDKAGSVLNLLRWVSPRTIKETFDPPTDYRYPFMEKE
ncbi:MAG: L-glutamate gamma-semialdehyde dehydrogenase [Gemmatimonadota bacterium]